MGWVSQAIEKVVNTPAPAPAPVSDLEKMPGPAPVSDLEKMPGPAPVSDLEKMPGPALPLGGALQQESRSKAEPPPFDPNNPVGMGEAGIQVVVYGPDGTAYGTPAAARAAGVTNYSMSPPAAAAPAAPAYTQAYVPGTTRARDEDNNEIALPVGYGAPIYGGAAGGRDRGAGGNQLIGRVGMVPVITENPNGRGGPTITFADDPTYKKSQKQIDFEKKIASGAIESTGMYESTSGGKGEQRAFADRNAAYTSYDPATNMVRFYDPEGNVTQEGQRSSGGGGLFGGGGGFLGINFDDLSKTLTTDSSTSGLGALGKELTSNELVNAAAVTAAAYFGGPAGAAAANGLISRAQGNDWNQVANNAAGAALLTYAAPLAYDAITGAAAPVAETAVAPVAETAVAAPHLTPAAMESMMGSAGYGMNASALNAAINAGIPASLVGSGAYNAAAQFGGSGSLFDAAASPLASGYGGATGTALTNEAVASGMAPGALGASMAAQGLLSPEALAAAYGTTGLGSSLYDLATLGNANALKQLAEAGTPSNIAKDIAKALGSSGGSQPNLSQLAINMLSTQDQGKNPGGFLDPTNLSTGSAQQNASILRDLPQLAFGHGPTIAALANRAAPQGYKRGGLAHHQPEFITGATGHYVKGKGDGQSDDIPAMLADGEYVFDADTVAALGNGSSDAGAKRLDEMRQAIRKHKRSAPVDKIPPKAKSPLEYLKG